MGEAKASLSRNDHLGSNSESTGPEDLRIHLGFIQSAITRMSASSTAAKSWMMPVVTASYGYALTQRADSIALLGIGAALLFAYLDVNYLRMERRLRALYSEVANGTATVPPFSINPMDVVSSNGDREKGVGPWFARRSPGLDVLLSWSVAPFYASIVAAGVVIAIRVA